MAVIAFGNVGACGAAARACAAGSLLDLIAEIDKARSKARASWGICPPDLNPESASCKISRL